MSTARTYQFDVDTKRYLNRVNTYRALNGLPDIQKSDAADIDNFVIGLKDLGAWSGCIFWLMRSQHNIGTGSVVLCLGGGGVYDGTSVNSPTHGTNGMTFSNASSQYIAFGGTQIIPSYSNYTLMGVAQLTNVAAANIAVIGLGNQRGAVLHAASNGSTQARYSGHNVFGGALSTQLANGPTTSMYSSFAAGDNISVKFYINSGTPFNTQNVDARLNPASPLLPIIGAFNNTLGAVVNFWNGIIATAAMWNNIKLTDMQIAGVLSLYKSTIGKGLNLP